MTQRILAFICAFLLCAPALAQSYSPKTVITDKTQTLTNKTLTSAILTTPIINGNVTIELGANDTTLIFSAPSAARQVTFGDPGGNDSVVYLAATQTLTNKTINVSQLTGTLPIARGGTNNGSLGVSALGIYNGDGTKVVQTTAAALQSWRVNAGGTAVEAFTPSGTGDVVGPASAGDNSVPLYDGTTGKLIKAGVALGAAGLVLTSNGAGVPPSFQAVAGTGDVVGPASAGDNSLALYNGTTGKLIKAGVALGSATQVLTSNGPGVPPSFQAAGAGAGDVVGPASATDRSVALFNGTTGKLLKDGVALGASGEVFTSNGAGVDPTFQTNVSGAPINATYLTLSLNGSLTAERILTAGKGLAALVDTGANGTLTVPVEEQIADVRFGGDGQRAIPTSGTLTGEYWNDGNYTTTGIITCNRCRWHVRGTVNIDHAITVNTELQGGKGTAVTKMLTGENGGGIGPGQGGSPSSSGGDSDMGGGGGGGNGGAGGSGGNDTGRTDRVSGSGGGINYFIENYLGGSSGGSGGSSSESVDSGAGGAGGGGFLLESTGGVTINGDILADGGDGADGEAVGNGAGGGGGGGGGSVDVRSQSTVTIQATKTIFARGGAGGAGTSTRTAGGGGGGGTVFLRGSTVTNNGTITVTGGLNGAGGSGSGAGNAKNGAAGISDLASTVYGRRSPN